MPGRAELLSEAAFLTMDHPGMVSAVESHNEETVGLNLSADLDFSAQDSLYATHGLHAFAAKCPPQVVRWAIERYSHPNDVVLDPMVGSGTTIVEARLQGRFGVGIDIDPIARLLAVVKATPIPIIELEEDCTRLAADVAKACRAWDSKYFGQGQTPPYPAEVKGMERWFEPRVAGHLSVVKDCIRAQVVRIETRLFFWAAMSSLIIARTSVANARDLVHSRHHFRAHVRPPDVPNLLLQRLRAMRRMMADFEARCQAAPTGPMGKASVGTLAGDARCLPLASESVDLVFTSPPYCNALDYTRAHKFGMAWLADVLGTDLPSYVQMGREYIGSERGRFSKPVDGAIPNTPAVHGVLEAVEAHDRGKGLVLRRYFRDVCLVLGEVTRVLRPNRSAVLVVCPSHIRNVDVPTHLVFIELAASLPLIGGASLLLEGVVERRISERRRVMPYLQDKFGKRMEKEYLIVFKKVQQG